MKERCEMKNIHIGVLIIIGWLLLLLLKPLSEFYDDITTSQPWWDVDIDVRGNMVDYDRTANRWMRGSWTAFVSVPSPKEPSGWETICTGDGQWTYRPRDNGEITRSFSYISGGCKRPDTPFRLCLDYVMTDKRNVTRDFGPFCDVVMNQLRPGVLDPERPVIEREGVSN